jgi:hypothetical protein
MAAVHLELWLRALITTTNNNNNLLVTQEMIFPRHSSCYIVANMLKRGTLQ